MQILPGGKRIVRGGAIPSLTTARKLDFKKYLLFLFEKGCLKGRILQEHPEEPGLLHKAKPRHEQIIRTRMEKEARNQQSR